MEFSPLINQLIQAFRCLPSVGPKTAQRMAFHLLERDKQGGQQLANTLLQSLEEVGNCSSCRTLTEEETCQLCLNPKRDASLLCIVQTPADLLALEASGVYQGKYFVLLGQLSPLDGLGPEDLGLDQLLAKLENENISEVILATNPTLEGETTAHYLAQLLAQHPVTVSHLAKGVPLGGELEYLDGGTLQRAFAGRQGLPTTKEAY